jgi:cysteine desulfurase
VLLKKENLPWQPLQGGSQEWGFRGGTENLLGIAALGAALKALHAGQEEQNEHLKGLKDFLTEFFKTQLPQLDLTTPEGGGGLHILHFIMPEGAASLLVVQADLAGIALSAGSACSSGSVAGSKVLKALGYSDVQTARGIRISWGWDTTMAQAVDLCNRLKKLF